MGGDGEAGKYRVMRFLAGEKVSVRLYSFLRLASCPFEIMERYVPREGLIADLGCGYGLLPAYLRLRSPGRKVIGIDSRAERVRSFSRFSAPIGGLTGKVADIRAVEFDSRCDCCILCDVLYQLPLPAAAEVIARCSGLLGNNGVLLIKEIDPRAGIRTVFTFFQEAVVARLLGLNRERFRFLSQQEITVMIKKAGFSACETIDAGRGYPYPHILYVCRKGC